MRRARGGCSTDPHVTVEGKIVTFPEGTPAKDVDVRLAIDTSARSPSSDITTTDGAAFYSLHAEVPDAGKRVSG